MRGLLAGRTPGLAAPGIARPCHTARRHVATTRAVALDMGQVQAAGQDVGRVLSSTVLEPLKAAAVEPHWGSKLVGSALERWLGALNEWLQASVDPSGSAVPVKSAQAALGAAQAQLQAALQQLRTLPGAGGQLGGEQLRSAVEGLLQSVQALVDAAAAKLPEVGALPRLELPPLSLSMQLPSDFAAAAASSDTGMVMALGALAGGLAVVAAAAARGSGPGGGSSSGGGPGSGGPGGGSRPSGTYLPSVYDAEQVAAYFEARPGLVATRSAQVAAEAAKLGAALLLDQATGQLDANSWRRAAQVRSVIERLGPAYVKVAQALSTRVDLLSPPYLAEIERLQDRVQPFPDDVAMQMIATAYGRPVGEVFSRISPSPVAAASLGQVYRGTLRPEYGGGEAAVKVRRPGCLQSVGLDLYLMRQVALYLRTGPQVKSDWVGIIDHWAAAFFSEMDYEVEAENARLFKQDVEEKDLTGVVVPEVLHATPEVLVTQWIEGEKLSESNAADVRELCNTLLSAYLVQLLETGRLHADPHPGNLLRTPDGKVAVLDFGLMQTVPPDYSLALVEYIAHLSVGDYEAIVDDLVALGFLAPGTDREGLVEPLGVLLTELKAGGGAQNINIDVVMSKIEELAGRYPFQVPPYFALILRCFSVIEGIALRVDPQYAIVSECFPYLARRLLRDNHPRARAALRDLLYGRDGQRLDVERLQRMADGFSAYTVAGLTEAPARQTNNALPVAAAAGAGALAGSGAQLVAADDVAGDHQPLLSPAAKEALRVMFSAEGNYAQELLVEEAVATVDAASRQLAATALGSVLGSAPALASLSAIEALGPWRSVLLPLPTPLELLNRVAPALQPSEDDLAALATARGVMDLVQRAPTPLPGPPSPSDALRLAQEVGPLLPELMPGMARTGQMFATALVQRVSVRVAADLQPGAAGAAGPGSTDGEA